jgi:hypothetical protein
MHVIFLHLHLQYFHFSPLIVMTNGILKAVTQLSREQATSQCVSLQLFLCSRLLIFVYRVNEPGRDIDTSSTTSTLRYAHLQLL